MQQSASDGFGDAVDRIVDAVRRGRPGHGADLDAVLCGLIRYLRPRFGGVLGDLSDVASEAILRFMERLSERDDIDERGGAGLLTTIARNIAVDAVRASGRQVSLEGLGVRAEDEAVAEDEIAALLGRGADAAAVESGLAAAFWNGDFEVVRIVRIWLDLADELGRAPTLRESACACGTSHTTIARALDRFAGYVPREGSQTKT